MTILTASVILALLALSAKDIGHLFRRVGLPLISGFLFVGVISGPHVLALFDAETRDSLAFVNLFSLAFIAFAAGSELHLDELRGRLRSILSIIAAQVVAVYFFGILAFILLAPRIPFMQHMGRVEIVAVAILGATIMIARSPASAYAIIKELRARGPFTQRVLGVTILKDSVVILFFATAVSVAGALLEGGSVDVLFLLLIAFEILLDIVLGIGLGFVLRLVLAIRLDTRIKGVITLALGYGVFYLADALRGFHIGEQHLSLFSEPLLVCLVAGFVIANFSAHAAEFHQIVEDFSLPIFILFFMLVGIDMNLEVLSQTWVIVLALMLARILGIFAGSFAGGMLGGDPPRENAILGFTFLTQAGVSVGLAQEIGVEFQPWGLDFATLSIAVIVINQFVGPPLFKWAIQRVGEAHSRADAPAFDGENDAVIFGVDFRALALARQLQAHGWQTKLVCLDENELNGGVADDLAAQIYMIPDLTAEALAALDIGRADAVVAMVGDDEVNYQVCELVYEQIGIENMVVFLRDVNSRRRFQELGVSVVEASTAVLSLLDHSVRSPAVTSVFLGEDPAQDIVEIAVHDPALDGVPLRDIHLPLDAIILSVEHGGQTLVPHGYTLLHAGDHVTVLGEPEAVEEMALRLAGVPLPDASLRGTV